MTDGPTDEISAAFVAALGELGDVTRTRTANAGTYSYRYADLGDVLSAVRPVLAAHGLAVYQVPYVEGREVAVVTTIMHTSGQTIESLPLRLPVGATAQQTGSAITYARRYALLAILGLATEDDDGATAAPHPPPLLSKGNVERFRQAASDAGLSIGDVADIVLAATRGRVGSPDEVHQTELQALRQAFAEFVGSGEVDNGEGLPSPLGAGTAKPEPTPHKK